MAGSCVCTRYHSTHRYATPVQCRMSRATKTLLSPTGIIVYAPTQYSRKVVNRRTDYEYRGVKRCWDIARTTRPQRKCFLAKAIHQNAMKFSA